MDSCLLGTCKGRAPEFPSLRASFPSVPFVRLARAVALSGPFASLPYYKESHLRFELEKLG